MAATFSTTHAVMPEAETASELKQFLFQQLMAQGLAETGRQLCTFKQSDQVMSQVYTPPPRTILEVYQNLPEGTLAQLINNHIYMSPAPTTSHQSVLLKIGTQLYDYVQKNNLGSVFIAPVDVYLNRKNAYQPDIIFIANANIHKLQESGFYGAPDLVIEILSPGTWRFDKEDKKDVYESSGVKEYWMVEPADKTTEGFYLNANEYQPLLSQKGEITFKTLSHTISF
jgi:Uma2 family endonuclease